MSARSLTAASEDPRRARGDVTPSIVWRKCRTAVRLLPTVLVYAVNAIWAMPAVLLMRAVRPWVQIRVRRVFSDRIGHFVGDTSLFLVEQDLRAAARPTIDLFWFADQTSNAQWARMVRRTLHVRWWVRYLSFFNGLFPGAQAHVVPATSGTRDTSGLLQQSPVRFTFTAEEDDRARTWLRSRGWRDGEPFASLLVRDSAYLAIHQTPDGESGRWDYHSYRDSDIGAYGTAVEGLLARGWWVIRMGKTMRERLPLTHARLIDYPFVDDQDDLMDIWLAAHCTCFVSTGTGIDMVPIVYGRPVVFVNFSPLSHLFSFAESLCVPKRPYWLDSGRPLTLRESCAHTYLRSADYLAAGIGLSDLSPEEIAAAVDEAVLRIAGIPIATDGDDEWRQQRFWQVLRAWRGFGDLHGYLHPRSRVGAQWLRSMGEAFFE